jgi:anti-sigma factor RsiW
MNCEEIRERFFDTPANPPDAAVQAHLAGCPECANAWSALHRTMSLLDEWKTPEPSPFFDSRLRAHLADIKAEEAGRQAGFFAWLRKPAFGMPMWRPLGAGALAVVMVFGAGLLNVRDDGQTVTTTKVTSAPGTAVSDLQALENNEEAISHLELLDDLTAEEGEDNL